MADLGGFSPQDARFILDTARELRASGLLGQRVNSGAYRDESRQVYLEYQDNAFGDPITVMEPYRIYRVVGSEQSSTGERTYAKVATLLLDNGDGSFEYDSIGYVSPLIFSGSGTAGSGVVNGRNVGRRAIAQKGPCYLVRFADVISNLSPGDGLCPAAETSGASVKKQTGGNMRFLGIHGAYQGHPLALVHYSPTAPTLLRFRIVASGQSNPTPDPDPPTDGGVTQTQSLISRPEPPPPTTGTAYTCRLTWPDGAATGIDRATVYDSLGMFGTLPTGFEGWCWLQNGRIEIQQGPCPG